MYKQIEDFCAGEIPRVVINIDVLREKLPERAIGYVFVTRLLMYKCLLYYFNYFTV